MTHGERLTELWACVTAANHAWCDAKSDDAKALREVFVGAMADYDEEREAWANAVLGCKSGTG